MIEEAAGGLAGVASPMMFEEVHTYRHADYVKRRMLQHFLAKLDARKSDESKRGAIQSLQEIKKTVAGRLGGGGGGGGGAAAPPMIVDSNRVQFHLCKKSKK